MLPLTRTRKFRISNRLAIFAALLLVVTSLAGMGGSDRLADRESALHASSMIVDDAPALLHSGNASKAKANKGFKMSLFLFRHR
jgi:hypothetical protein